jgi:hypothetical protein
MREQAGEPFGTCTEEMELIVEEHIELLYLHTKELSETKMPSLVQDHQQTEAA